VDSNIGSSCVLDDLVDDATDLAPSSHSEPEAARIGGFSESC
jgi:hypothetical protein